MSAPRKVSDDDERLIILLGERREKLREDLAEVSIAKIAEQFGLSRSEVRTIFRRAGLNPR